ncbi:MAG: TonB-dependent receptor [Pyrinomonadaceae bacterium]
MFNKTKFAFLSLSLLICLTMTAFGQETTGGIEGTVKDQSGAVIPGAEVTITSDSFRRTLTTNDSGYFRAVLIPVGIYKVTVAATNFQSLSRENVQVTLGSNTPVNLALKVGGVGAQVDVVADENLTIDPTSSKIQTNLTKEELDRLPKGTNFTTALKAVPSVRNEPAAAGFSVDGATGVENSFVIDGQEVGNFRTGSLNSNNNLPFQLVQEVQVKNSGFEAEFGGATGGVINLVTRGGENDWHGDVGADFRPNRLGAIDRPILRADPRNLQYIIPNRDEGLSFFPSASLSGPIIKNRLWFLASTAPQFVRNERIYTFPDGSVGEFRREDRFDYSFARIDSAITDNLRVFSTFTYNPIKINGLLPGYNTLVASNTVSAAPSVDPEFQSQQGGRQPSSNFNVGGNYVAGSNFVFSSRFSRGYLNEKIANYGIPDGTRFQCATSGLPYGFNCDVGYNNFLNDRTLFDISKRTNFEADASILLSNFGGRHQFKFGYQRFGIFNTISDGYVGPGRVLFFFGQTTAAEDGTIFGARPGEVGYARLVQIGTSGTASSASESLYVQDSWQPLTNLTLNLGVRIERENVPSFAPGAPGIDFSFSDKIAPRLGFAWDVLKNGKIKIFGNYGEFFDRFKYELPRGSFGGDTFLDYRAPLLASMTNIFDYTLAYVQANSLVFTDFRVPSNDPSDFRVEPDLKPVRQKEYTFGTQIDFGNQTLLSARYTRKTLNETIEDIGYHDTSGNEAYFIGNPGRGICAEAACGQYDVGAPAAKPKRQYDAVEMILDKRFGTSFILNANYTWSRLYGNYSGLASTDEFLVNGGARNSPNVNRFFDTPADGFVVGGAPNDGLLPTDRTHVFKVFGTYMFNNNSPLIRLPQNQELEMSAFFIGQSGTPLTTRVDLIDNAYIPLFGRGDLGRTEVFTETDASMVYRYKFGRDNKFTMQLNVDVLNLFNENHVLGLFESISDHVFESGDFAALGVTIGDNQDFDRAFFDGRITADRITSLINNNGNSINTDQRYQQPIRFQNPRTVRFGFKFSF